MDNWKTSVGKIKEHLKSKNISAAKEELTIGFEKFPNQLNLLINATDVYRASGDREKSLEYAELLTTHYPYAWQGYGRAAQDLAALRRFDDAQARIQAGLEKIPNQVNLLTIAANIYSASGDHEKSLDYAEKMHVRNIEIPANIFSELLIHSFKKRTLSEGNKHKSQVAAIDWFHNRRFALSSDQMPFNYFFIPKNACTSIKYSLLTKFTDAKEDEIIARGTHRMANVKLKSDLDFEKEFICLVRNPFSRFISAFTDKCNSGDLGVWLPLCKKYGFSPTSRISMDTLLDALLADEPNLIDGHFRPQHKITCSTAITPSRIFHMEQISEFASFLQAHDCEFIFHAPHSTKAKAKKPDELDSKTIDKIYRLYKDDFVLYGYSENPQIKESLGSIAQSPRISSFLTSKDAGEHLCRDSIKRDSLLFDELFLEKTASIRLLVNNSLI